MYLLEESAGKEKYAFGNITNVDPNNMQKMDRYSDSIDGDFVISPHPDYHNLIVAAGDSGHGLK